MARSDERAAVPDPVWVTVYDRHNGVMMELDKVRKQLAAQGLHVVSDAERRVLEAMADVPIERAPNHGLYYVPRHRMQGPILAELARREGKR